MTEPRRPVHLAVLLGASAGIYAVSLAGVTALQSSADRTVMDDRTPLEQTIKSVAAGHDALEADLARVTRAYGDAAARYDGLSPDLTGMETSLDALAASVSRVSGAAKSLPGHVALPTVTRSVVVKSAPATHATTGASGG